MNVARALCLGILTILTFAVNHAAAQPSPDGDTSWVRVYDGYLWTGHGQQTRWAVFPDSTHRYGKIRMHYRLKCPDGGCGEWDYTTKIVLLDHTGRIDSVTEVAPAFRVDGAIRDTVEIRWDTTWSTTYDPASGTIDSTRNDPLSIVYYSDPVDAFEPTDTVVAWPAGYTIHFRNDLGAVDSTILAPDTTLYVSTKFAKRPYEVVNSFEIGRLITPYGKWFPKDDEFDWVFDATDYGYLLHDSVEIRAVYDGWTQGSIFSLDFELVDGVPPVDVFRVENVYSGSHEYGNPNNPIEDWLVPTPVKIDSAAKYTRLKITTTGHGFNGTDNAAEFAERTHSVAIDGTTRFNQHLWRSDCGQNPVYPQSGTWYYSRGGWCPGDLVRPDLYDITPYVTPGGVDTIDYNMQPYTNDSLQYPASYIVEAQVLFGHAPNFTNDVEVTGIRRPSDDFRNRRRNPICDMTSPEIAFRNDGSDMLRSVEIRYGINGALDHSKTWHGVLKFMDEAVIALPGIDLGTDAGTFTVELSNPNGTDDEDPSNDTMSSRYDRVATFQNPVSLTLRTDDLANDPSVTNGISYDVQTVDGTVLYHGEGFNDRQTVLDTFDLEDGCYYFVIHDSYAGDGLIPIVGTAGSFILRDAVRRTVYNGGTTPPYLASFGNQEIIPFVVTSASSVSDPAKLADSQVRFFPNPTSGHLTVDISRIGHHGEGTVRVYSLEGKSVLSQPFAAGADTIAVDLTSQSAGTYLVLVNANGTLWSETVVLK